jgi:hypothetical protein
MAGLVPAIHTSVPRCFKDVDARDKPGQDEMMQWIAAPTPLR